MLEYDRIDISEGIDMDKTNKSRECDICRHWYFLDKTLIMKNIYVMGVVI